MLLNYQAMYKNWRETAEFVWEWLSSVCCARSCQASPLWSELTNNTLRKQRWDTFLYPQNWMPYTVIGITSYYCVILKMVILHDEMKTIPIGFLRVFLKNESLFLFKKTKKIGLKKKQKNRWGVFFKKRFFFSILIVLQSFLWFSLDRTIWNKSRHYQFDWVCATHLEYKSLVLKNVRIACIWIRKFSFWQQTKFLKFKSMQHVLVDLQ